MTEPAPALAPRRKPKAASSRTTARDVEAKVMSVVISSNRPISKAEIVAAVDGPASTVETTIHRLVLGRQIVAEGATRSRRYRAREHKAHTDTRAKVDQATARNAKRLDDAVSRVGLRDRVLKAIVADPAQLAPSHLALALNAHPDDIHDALEHLLKHDKIAAGTDGTYHRNGHQELAA